MLGNISLGLLAGGCCLVAGAATNGLDRGGVTFDFEALSAARFSIPSQGGPGNLVTKDAWTAGDYCEVHRAGYVLPADLRAKLKKAVMWEETNGVCRLVNTSEIASLAGAPDGKPLAPAVTSGFRRLVVLPDDKGGDYRISFRYRARHSVGKNSFYLLYFKRRDPKTGQYVEARSEANTAYTAGVMGDEWNGWTTFARNVRIPAGCEAVDFIMRLDGVGELRFKDVGFCRKAVDPEPVSLILSPQDAFGNEFALSRRQPAGIGFSIRKNTKDALDPHACRFRLRLPPGVEWLGASFGDLPQTAVSRRSDGGLTVEFPPSRRNWFQFDGKFSFWNRMIALVRTDLPVGSAAEATMDFLSREGRPLSKTARIRLSVIDEIRAERPKRYMNGIAPTGDSVRFHDVRADAAFAGLLKDCGVGWLVCCSSTPELIRLWREAGVRRITPTTALANGYHLTRDWKLQPASDAFRGDAESPVFGTAYNTYLSRSTCPFAVLEERPFFRTNIVVREIVEPLKGTDGLWANWEPFMFKGRGCNCAVCKAAFAKWHAETGGTLGDFRSMIHGKMVRVIDKYVRAASGGEDSVGFIPGVSWREMASVWRKADPSPETRPIDYAGDLRWINPWGPYVDWDAEAPYLYQKRLPLVHFVAAKDMREQTDRDFPVGRRPKLMSFPHGMQNLAWVPQPEWLEMALDSFFFNRWEASVVYYFPQGLDARFWRAFAQATTRAAKCERFVLDGRASSDLCELKPVREYATPCGYVTTYLPDYRDVPLLQHAAYDLDGTRLVAVLNFWEKGEAFFRLRTRGLTGKSYQVSDEAGVRYAKSSGSLAWSPEDLEKGLLLMVGAARTRAYFISPTSEGTGTVCAQQELRALYDSRRPDLSREAEADREYERNNQVRVDKRAEI